MGGIFAWVVSLRGWYLCVGGIFAWVVFHLTVAYSLCFQIEC